MGVICIDISQSICRQWNSIRFYIETAYRNGNVIRAIQSYVCGNLQHINDFSRIDNVCSRGGAVFCGSPIYKGVNECINRNQGTIALHRGLFVISDFLSTSDVDERTIDETANRIITLINNGSKIFLTIISPSLVTGHEKPLQYLRLLNRIIELKMNNYHINNNIPNNYLNNINMRINQLPIQYPPNLDINSYLGLLVGNQAINEILQIINSSNDIRVIQFLDAIPLINQ